MTDNLTIEDSNETFESWITKDFVSEGMRQGLQEASILLVPVIGFRHGTEPTFPVLTEDIYNYFKENLPKDVIVELCIDDAKYHELALHSDYKRIGNFVVKSVALPLFVAILSQYINDKYVKPEAAAPQVNIINVDNSVHTTVVNPVQKKQVPKKYLEPTNVQVTVTVVDSGKISKEFKYEGPAKDVKAVGDEILKFWNNDTARN